MTTDNSQTGAWRLVADGMVFPEGPTLLSSGELLWTDADSGTLLISGGDAGKAVVATIPARILGTAALTQTRIVVACASPAGLAFVDLASGEQTGIDLRPHDIELVNDIAIGADGTVLFTDSGSDENDFRGGVWRLDGSEPFPVRVPLRYANGILIDAANSRVLIAETSNRRILSIPYPVRAGQDVKPAVFATMEGGVGPDGLAVDGAGNVYVAHYGTGLIHVYSSDGELIGDILAPGLNPTNLILNPTTGDLFLTEAESGAVWMLPGDGILPHRMPTQPAHG